MNEDGIRRNSGTRYMASIILTKRLRKKRCLPGLYIVVLEDIYRKPKKKKKRKKEKREKSYLFS
jgi:hypothetical protein